MPEGVNGWKGGGVGGGWVELVEDGRRGVDGAAFKASEGWWSQIRKWILSIPYWGTEERTGEKTITLKEKENKGESAMGGKKKKMNTGKKF